MVLSLAMVSAACSSNEVATPAPVESELASDSVDEIGVGASGQCDEEPQMTFGECLDDEEMCWEWSNEAENSPDCGPANDHDYCWEYKVFKPFISLNPEDLSSSPIDADAQSRAQRIVD